MLNWRGGFRYRVGVASLFVVFLWVVLAAWAVFPLALGWRPVVITSGSMGPAIAAGDVVVVEPHDGSPVSAGKIITFDDGAGLLTHRIVEVNADGDYVTKGDGNTLTDSVLVSPDAVVGVGRLLIPVIGLPVSWAVHGNWLLVVAWFALMSAAFWCARWGFLRPIRLLGRHGAIEPWARVPISGKRRRFATATTGMMVAVLVSLVAAVPAIAMFAGTSSNGSNVLTAASSFGDELTLYLHNNPTPPVGNTNAQAVLPMTETAPSATTLYRYSANLLPWVGRYVMDGGISYPDEGAGTHASYEQNWDFVAPTVTPLEGTATVTLSSALYKYEATGWGYVAAYLYECNTPVTACTEITNGWTSMSPWNPTGAFTEYSVDLGTLSHSVGVGNTLRLEVFVFDQWGRGMHLAYDTTTYQSRLEFSG